MIELDHRPAAVVELAKGGKDSGEIHFAAAQLDELEGVLGVRGVERDVDDVLQVKEQQAVPPGLDHGGRIAAAGEGGVADGGDVVDRLLVGVAPGHRGVAVADMGVRILGRESRGRDRHCDPGCARRCEKCAT
jgi:hypothetical protein